MLARAYTRVNISLGQGGGNNETDAKIALGLEQHGKVVKVVMWFGKRFLQQWCVNVCRAAAGPKRTEITVHVQRLTRPAAASALKRNTWRTSAALLAVSK